MAENVLARVRPTTPHPSPSPVFLSLSWPQAHSSQQHADFVRDAMPMLTAIPSSGSSVLYGSSTACVAPRTERQGAVHIDSASRVPSL